MAHAAGQSVENDRPNDVYHHCIPKTHSKITIFELIMANPPEEARLLLEIRAVVMELSCRANVAWPLDVLMGRVMRRQEHWSKSLNLRHLGKLALTSQRKEPRHTCANEGWHMWARRHVLRVLVQIRDEVGPAKATLHETSLMANQSTATA